MNTIRDYAYQTAKLPELDSEPLMVIPLKLAKKLFIVLNDAQFVPNHKSYVEVMKGLEHYIDRSKRNDWK